MAPYGDAGSRGEYRGGGANARGGRGGARGRGGRPAVRPTLPSNLMDEVHATYGESSTKISRKDLRKASRQKGPIPTSQSSQRASSYRQDEQQATPAAQPKMSAKAKGKRPMREEEEETEVQDPPKKTKKRKEITLPGASTIDAEDQEIEWLEWMLQKEKAKNKDEVFDDGLDDILDFADIIGPGGSGLEPGQEEEDLDSSSVDDDNDEGDEDDDDDDDDEDELEDSDEGSESGDSDLEGEQSDALDVNDGSSESKSTQLDELVRRSDGEAVSSTDNTTFVGGPLKADPGKVADVKPEPSRYVPPHMRAALLAEKAAGDKEKMEEKRKLERKLQGLLNKSNEANLDGIIAEVEEVFRNHSRNDVTTSLTALVMQVISSRSNLLDSFVVLYATLIGSLHRIIGLEFGAHFVQTLVLRYRTLSQDPKTDPTAIDATIYETPDISKEALNLLTLIAELFNAGVIGSGLIYDLIRGFIHSGSSKEILGELATESLLKVLKCCGPQLRTDDPASLKDIVNLVQTKVKGQEKTMTVRARFMVETLTNINKSGKVKTGAEGEQGNEAAARMKKYLSSLGRKKHLLATEPLRISLSDLLTADTRGKWWLIGAGWKGNPLVEIAEARAKQPQVKAETDKTDAATDEKALLALARKQGMNTDIRRSVFVVLMTSEDYVHACDQLSHLRLTDVQQREYIRVALHCCGLEKRYNPYYTLVLNHLCANSYDHRFTLQYALWDFLRELASQEPSKALARKSANIAKAIAYVVGRGSIEISVLKAVEWTELNTQTSAFLTSFLVHLLISTQTASPLFVLPKSYSDDSFDPETVEEVFDKCLSNLELAQGLLVVIKTKMGKKIIKILEDLDIKGKEKQAVLSGLDVAKLVLAQAI